MTRIWALGLLATVGLAAQTPQRLPLRAAAETIRAADLLRDITYLASDELAGRATPSPGQDLAASYIERALKEIGVKPFGDAGGYRQHYVVTRTNLKPEATTLRVGEREFHYGEDFVLTSFLARGGSRGRVVSVGNGIRSPKLGWDPYKGLDVRGKWLLVTAPTVLPDGVTRATLGQPGVDHMLPAQEARTRGALGLLIIPPPAFTTFDAVTPKPTTARDLSPSVGWAYSQNPLPQVMLSKTLAESLVTDPNQTVALTIAGENENTDAYNVVGIIEGSDASLKEQYITVSSHLDGAVGRNPVNGDAIYNAADDNASGSAGNLAIARALMQGPRPRRTLVLIWDTGEETGLWGSRHVAYGSFSDKIVAHLCVDMIGRTKKPGSDVKGEEDLAGPGEVFAAGPGVLSTQMDRVLLNVERDYGFAKQNRKFDSASESFFYPRTDAAPYFERKIPYVEFFTGLHADYHRPSDDVAKIDPAKMEAVARTVYAVVTTLGERLGASAHGQGAAAESHRPACKVIRSARALAWNSRSSGAHSGSSGALLTRCSSSRASGWRL